MVFTLSLYSYCLTFSSLETDNQNTEQSENKFHLRKLYSINSSHICWYHSFQMWSHTALSLFYVIFNRSLGKISYLNMLQGKESCSGHFSVSWHTDYPQPSNDLIISFSQIALILSKKWKLQSVKQVFISQENNCKKQKKKEGIRRHRLQSSVRITGTSQSGVHCSIQVSAHMPQECMQLHKHTLTHTQVLCYQRVYRLCRSLCFSA